ncbi:MAG: S9 family peptidase [Candidatus Krumholzibacteria bacterium]|nr:S9 family peptidase [Candidatus Krumholzibacteria bacterium]
MKNSIGMRCVCGLAACMAMAFLAISCAKEEPKLIPTGVLFGNPTRTMPCISPDAKKLSYVAPYNGVLNIWVKTIGRTDDRAITRDADRGISKYFWAYDNKHILYFQDLAGTDNWRLYGIDVDTGEICVFSPFVSLKVGVVAYSKRFPREFIIQMNKENRGFTDAYRLDVETGALVMAAKNPGNVVRWIPDNDLVVRGALVSEPQGGSDLIVRKGENSPWVKVCSWNSEDRMSSGALRFTRDGAGIYCFDARGFNTGRLVEINIVDGSVTAIAEDPESEIVSAFFQVDTYEMQAVAFEREHIEWAILDNSLRSDFDAVAKLDRGDFRFMSTDASDSTWVLGFNKDDGPVSYFLYDRRTKQGTFLFDEQPDLRNYRLARMEPVSFKARDGLEIHGYITYPAGGKRQNLPLVLLVRPDPWTRDYWGFNPEVQWLASRGYACLQVNFRGCRGYGKDFSNAGNKEWGGKMQDDLEDGVQWAVSEGIANPKRMAIFGSSFGGYAALVGLTSTPDLFRCGVDISGPSDLLGWLAARTAGYAEYKSFFYELVGNPETDADMLRSRSPLFAVDRIRAPLLVVQGGHDPFTPNADAERIVAALKKSGVPCEFIYLPDEGRGISKPQNRMKFWESAEGFLSEYLGNGRR